jgi:hypothetical protein
VAGIPTQLLADAGTGNPHFRFHAGNYRCNFKHNSPPLHQGAWAFPFDRCANDDERVQPLSLVPSCLRQTWPGRVAGQFSLDEIWAAPPVLSAKEVRFEAIVNAHFQAARGNLFLFPLWPARQICQRATAKRLL